MTEVPRDPEGMNDEAEAELDDLDEDEGADSRYTKRRWDKYVEKDGELSESEDEEENEANGVRKQPNAPKRRRNIMDYQNPSAAAEDVQIASGALSARSGRSVNGVNRSRRSSGANGEGSEADLADGDRDASPGSSPPPDTGNEDVEMADNPAPHLGAPHSTDGAQEATPPNSPPAEAANPSIPSHVAEDTGNDAMDEGDTLDDPDLAKEEGHDEREKEDVTAEQTAEAVEQAEEE